MVISDITTEDIDELKELQPDGWPDITPKMNFYIQSPFCKPIKILSGRRIAGILKSDGFEYVKQGARMSMGRPLLFQPKMLFNRIAGNVG